MNTKTEKMLEVTITTDVDADGNEYPRIVSEREVPCPPEADNAVSGDEVEVPVLPALGAGDE